MKVFSTAIIAALAAGNTLAQSQEYGAGLLEALQSAGLTSLASAAQNASALITALQEGGNKTVLAPSNDAFAQLGNVSTEALIATLQYHVLNGTVRVGDISEDGNTIVNSFLTNAQYVQLPNNASQVVVLSRTGDNSYSVVEGARNVSFASGEDGPTYQNLLVQPINTVLTIPGNLSSVVTALNATQLASALTQANLLETLQNSRNGLTVFAPTDAAFQAAQSAISAATPEQLANVLATHVINGTVAYSSLLTGDNAVTSAVSASGNNLTFAMADGGLTVSSGNATARIVRTDVLANNGVVHVIDAVLANTEANPGAASSAFSSATAAAATQTAGAGGNAGSGSTDAPNAAAKVTGGAALVAATVAGAFVALAA